MRRGWSGSSDFSPKMRGPITTTRPACGSAGTQTYSPYEKAVRLNPHLADAFLLLGVVFSAQNKFPDAIPAYQKAIAANPDLAQAHYRLAQAWTATGQPARAREEIELYRQLSRQSEQKSEAERAAIQEFVFSLRDKSQ